MHNDIAAVKKLANVALVSVNGNANIGDGHMGAAFQVVANVMTLHVGLVWGTTSTFGTGGIKVPLPAGYSVSDIDGNAMSDFGGLAATPVNAQGTIAAVPSTPFLLGLLGGGNFLLYPLDTYALGPGDFLIMKLSFPLK